MIRNRFALAAVLACLLPVFWTGAAIAQDPNDPAAMMQEGDRFAGLGETAFDNGEFAEAARHYMASARRYELAQGEVYRWRIVMLVNAALSFERAGQLHDATRFYSGITQLLIDNGGVEPDQLRLALYGWSRVLVAQGRTLEAHQVSRVTLDWVERNNDPASLPVIRAMGQLVNVLRMLRRVEEADRYAAEMLSRVRSAEEPDAQNLIWTLNIVADARFQSGDYAGAEAYSLEALAEAEAYYGPSAPELTLSLLNLASALMRQGKCENALQLTDRAGQAMEGELTFQQLHANYRYDIIAECQVALGRNAEAEAAVRASLDFALSNFAETSPAVIVARNNLAAILFRMGRVAESLALHRENLSAALATFTPEHADVGLAHENVGEAALYLGDYDTATRHLRQALAIYRSEYGTAYAETVRASGNLAWALLETGTTNEALSLVRYASDGVALRISQDRDDLDPRHRQAILETHISTAFALSQGDAP